METFDRIAIYVLFTAASIAVIVGLVVIVLAHTLTRSRVTNTNELLEANLQTAKRVAGALNDHQNALQRVARLPAHAAEASRRLPPLLQASTDAMRTTVETTRRTAAALQTVETGTDFLTPGSPVSQQVDSLERLAKRLADLRKQMLDTREPVGDLVDQLGAAVTAQRSLTDALADAGVGPEVLERRLERTLELQHGTNIAAAAAWQQTGIGGAYLLLGLVLAGVGGIWRRLAHPDTARSLPPSEP